MQKTEKLGLNLFEGTDPVLAESFNENSALLDAALRRKCDVVTGTYHGDNTTGRALTFDSKPMLVIGSCPLCMYICLHGCAEASIIRFDMSDTLSHAVSWDDETNSLIMELNGYMNHGDYDYNYLAFLES